MYDLAHDDDENKLVVEYHNSPNAPFFQLDVLRSMIKIYDDS